MFNTYPYTDFHEMNLDWVINKVKELIAEWAQTSENWADTQQAWEDMKTFINTYFDNLNVQEEINNKIDALVADGTLSELIAPFVASGLPDVVADQISAVVAAQIAAVVANQLPSVAASQLPDVVASQIAGQAAEWLEANVDPDTGYVIDKSLTVGGAAADAKITGDYVKGSTGFVLISPSYYGKYVNTSGDTVDVTTQTSSATYNCYVIGCTEGDVFTVNAKGGGTARAFAFVASDGTNLRNAASNADLHVVLTAPENAAYLVINNNVTTNPDNVIYAGNRLLTLSQGIDNVNGRVDYLLKPFDASSVTWARKVLESNGSLTPAEDQRHVTSDGFIHAIHAKIEFNESAVIPSQARMVVYDKLTQSRTELYPPGSASTPHELVVSADFELGFLYTAGGSNPTFDSASMPEWAKVSDFITYDSFIDKTFLKSGYAADAKETGDRLTAVENAVNRTSVMSRLDGRWNAIAYSKLLSYPDGEPCSVNTKEHFLYCAQRSEFASLKADMRLTSDGKVVLCHDAGFTLDGSGDIINYDSSNKVLIHDLTYAECIALKHAGTGQYVVGLDTVVSICKMYGKNLFITLRNEYVDDTLSVLFDCLDQCRMRDYTIINMYPAGTTNANKIRAIDSNIVISYTAGGDDYITTELVDTAAAIGNCIYCTDKSPSDEDLDAKESVIEYAYGKGVPVYVAIISVSNRVPKLASYGVVGGQCQRVPNYTV